MNIDKARKYIKDNTSSKFTLKKIPRYKLYFEYEIDGEEYDDWEYIDDLKEDTLKELAELAELKIYWKSCELYGLNSFGDYDENQKIIKQKRKLNEPTK